MPYQKELGNVYALVGGTVTLIHQYFFLTNTVLRKAFLLHALYITPVTSLRP